MQSSRKETSKFGIDADIDLALLAPGLIEELRAFHAFVNTDGFGRFAAVSIDWASVTEPSIVALANELFDWLETNNFNRASLDAYSNLHLTNFVLGVAGTKYLTNMLEVLTGNYGTYRARLLGVVEELSFKDKVTICAAVKSQIKGFRCQYHLARQVLIHFFDTNDKPGFDAVKTQLETLPAGDYCSDDGCSICSRTHEIVDKPDLDDLFSQFMSRVVRNRGPSGTSTSGPSSTGPFGDLFGSSGGPSLPPGVSIRRVPVVDAPTDALRRNRASCDDQDCFTCRQITEELERRSNSNPNDNQPN